MARFWKKLPQEIVRHPRYGVTPEYSGYEIPKAEAERLVRQCGTEKIFLESVIPADITQQKFSCCPLEYYVDMLLQCRVCKRCFLFFAKEQKFWYETLKKPVFVGCTHCPECRAAHHQIRRRLQRYSEFVVRTDLSDSELETLVDDVVFLWQANELRKKQRLYTLRKLALQRIPASPATARLEEIIAGLNSQTQD